jgi:hypothetical protein
LLAINVTRHQPFISLPYRSHIGCKREPGRPFVAPFPSKDSEEASMKPRRYLFAVVDGDGNVPTELSAARRLVERGHAVTVLAENSVASEVRATGAALRRWAHAPNRPDRAPEHDPARDWECTYPWQLVDRFVATLMVGPAAAYTQDVSDAIREARPDLVACSMFCLGGMVAAEAPGIPFDIVLPNVYPFPAHGLPPFGLGLQPARGIAGRFRDRLLNSLADPSVGGEWSSPAQCVATSIRSAAPRTLSRAGRRN